MLEGWEIAEVTKQKAAEFGRKCDWCDRRAITHMVVGNNQRFPMVCGNCYREERHSLGPTSLSPSNNLVAPNLLPSMPIRVRLKPKTYPLEQRGIF